MAAAAELAALRAQVRQLQLVSEMRAREAARFAERLEAKEGEAEAVGRSVKISAFWSPGLSFILVGFRVAQMPEYVERKVANKGVLEAVGRWGDKVSGSRILVC